MSNPLRNASAEVRARVRELGGDDLVAALTRLVEDEEESTVLWFDAHEEGYSAEEILDWAVVDVVALGAAVYVELNIEFAAYADVGEEGMIVLANPAYARIILGPPMTADRFEFEPENLRSFIATQAP